MLCGFSAIDVYKRQGLYALVLGDLFMKVVYHTRPYELVPGETNKTYERLNGRCKAFLMKKHPSWSGFKQLCNQIVDEFDHILVTEEQKPRVGIVGEILVKFSPSANNGLVDLLESEGAEAVVQMCIRDRPDIPYTVLEPQY